MEVPPRPASRQYTMHTERAESGLAEWTQKIKAIQRQVDADEEEEHRKLEQEIAASRLARVRRSSGYPSRAATVDAATSSDSLRADSLHDDHPPSTVDRQRDQADALHKLTGTLIPSAKPPSSRSDPVSLAAFIGGRATGPRLNKHAPQQDAHDPTQFEQRTRASITTPHPIFGRGGVAMPGLAAKHATPELVPVSERAAPEPTCAVEAKPAQSGYASEKEGVGRERKMSTSSAALRRYMNHVGQAVSPQPSTGTGRDAARVRTMSTPTGVAPVRAGPSSPGQFSQSKPSSVRSVSPQPPSFQSRTMATSPTPSSHAAPMSPIPAASPLLGGRSTPSNGRFTATSPVLASKPAIANYSPSPGSYTSSLASSPASRPLTPKQPSSSLVYPKPASISTPSLARPIQPSPKPPSAVPQLLSHSRSEAFLRNPAQKEPTPSISRLKGRGFVQSIVKASSQLEADVAHASVSETGRLAGGKRLSNVAERWKPEPSTPPADVARRSWTPREPAADPWSAPPTPKFLEPQHTGKTSRSEAPIATKASPPKIVEPQHTGKSVRKVPSMKALSATHTGGTSHKGATSPPSPGGRGMGSSSTMISYIKPMKTGDDPATAQSHSRPGTPSAGRPRSHSRPATPSASQVDQELGLRTNGGQKDGGARPPFEAPATVGRPLSHPTKSRAKKPRKAKGAIVTFAEPAKEARPELVSEVPVHAGAHVQHVAPKLLPYTPAPAANREASSAVTPSATPAQVRAPGQTNAPSIPQQLDSVSERWAHGSVTGAKSADNQAAQFTVVPPKPASNGLVGARPLPGLVTPVTPQPQPQRERSPRSPRRHSRIPSTGNRALVMDVAQVMQEQQQIQSTTPEPVSPEPQGEASSSPVAVEDISSVVRRPSDAPHNPATEKRRSSYDKYSAFALPVLKEERTPVSSPAPTLVRVAVPPVVEEARPAEPIPVVPASKPSPIQRQPSEESKCVKIQPDDGPLPSVDFDKLLSAQKERYTPDPNILSISVDVLSITGTTATPLKSDTHVFYESEVLAVVHRFKTKSSGLVATTVWGWRGKLGVFGEREDRKLKDLARHYGTSLESVLQHHETPDFVHILGGLLAIRQGTRQRWSPENTTMHQVRVMNGNIVIDQCDLGITNLCSAYSYCLTLLGTTYVWHGRGSLMSERCAALSYGQTLAGPGSEITVLQEGEDDDDEMFWMMLGDSEYAKADYWKYRPAEFHAGHKAQVWRVDTAHRSDPLKTVAFLSHEPEVNAFVYLIDCVWEIFILVGQEARAKRPDIRFSLFAASELAQRSSPSRPFTPTVHVLILPSKLPVDLRPHFRDLTEDLLNAEGPPEHMNILTSAEALAHLRVIHWEKTLLKDPTVLPLGLHPSHLA